MNLRKLAILPFLFASSLFAQVSYNTITGTVTDPNGTAFANATVTVTLVNLQGFAVTNVFTPNGQPFNGSPVLGTLDSAGHFSIPLVPNNVLHLGVILATNVTQWKITLSAPQDPNILTYQPAWNITYQFTVTGNADISSQLSALATQTIAWLNLKTNLSSFSGIGGGLPVNNPTFTGTMAGPTASLTTLTVSTLNGRSFTGTGTAIPTGPATSTAGNIITAKDTTGGLQDSGKTFNGTGAGVTTGPATSNANNVVTFNSAAGDIKDSGKALTGTGAAIPTGPSTSTANHVVTFSSAAGDIKDSGKAITGTGAAIPTGPTASTAGHVATFADTTGGVQDSGKALAGSSAALTTGPSSSTINDIATFNSTGGDIKDSGTALASLAPLASPTFTGTPSGPTDGVCASHSSMLVTEGYLSSCGAGTGNVSNSGTPVAGQAPEWVDATHVKGVSGTQFATDMGIASAPANMVVESTNYTITSGGYFVQATASGITITLPASPATGFSTSIVNAASSGTVTISPNAVAYDGATSLPAGEGVFIAWDGTSYHSSIPATYGTGLSESVSKTGKSISIAATGVAAGSCGDATHSCQVTYNAQGQATSMSNILISGVPAASSTWYNMVSQGGIDNTGATDVSSAIQAKIIGLGSQPGVLYFPPGTYKIDAGIQLACTASLCQGITILGAGRDSTFFTSACTNGYAWWLDSTAVSGSYWYGMNWGNFSIQDTSGSGACNSGLRITQVANFWINDIETDNFQGKVYSTGTISVTNGSTTVTGSGTTFTAAMVPGIIKVAGRPQFVCGFGSATSLTLCDQWQNATASGTSYSLQYNGTGLLLDGGSNFAQYCVIDNYVSSGDMVGIGTVPSTSGSIGISRCKIRGGFINGKRVADSFGTAWGQFTDTMDTNIAINNVGTCHFSDNAHDNINRGECENDGAATVVATCNGGVSNKSCITGDEWTGDSTTKSYGNSSDHEEVYNAGNAFKTDGTNQVNLSINDPRTGSGSSSSNTNDYNFNGTTGCPVAAAGVKATIKAFNCVHYQVTPTTD